MKSPNEDKLTEYILIGFGIIPVILAALTVAPFLSDGLAGIVKGLTHSMNNPINIQWCADSPKAILVFLAAYGTGIGVYFSTRRNYRRGEEHGSAKWGNARRTCKKYAEKDSRKNLILTQNVRMGLDGRMHRRNLNVLVVGGSGAGKTRFYAKPNIMQANTSYVVLDPNGNMADARAYFNIVGSELAVYLSRLGSKCEELDAMERLALIHNFFRPDEESDFYFDINDVAKKGHSFRDYICPDTFETERDCFRFGDRCGRVVFLRDYANYIKDDMITELCDIGASMMLSLDFIPIPTDEAVREVENRLLGVETNIANWQRRQNQSSNFSAVIPFDMEVQRRESKDFLNDLTNRDQRMMFGVLTAVITADNKRQLNSYTDALFTIGRKRLCQFSTLKYQQFEGLNTVLPYGIRKIDALRTLTTESAAVFMPFRVQEVFDKGGIYCGKNAISGNMIVVNKANLMNGSSFHFGIPGSGKSFGCKDEMTQIALSTDDDILVCDPEREYGFLREFGAEIIHIAAGSDDHINAMDMVEGYSDTKNPIAQKSQFIMSLLEQLDQTRELTSIDKSIIDRCTGDVYRNYRNGGPLPTLPALREVLLTQPEPEARDLALSLELFTKGSLNAFAYPTNVNTQCRILVYDILDLGEQLKTMGLLVITDAILNRVTENWRAGRRTHVYLDEFHVVYENPYSSMFFTSAWRRFRKRNAFPTGITQNVEYLLDNTSARSMLSNSEFIVMHNQAASDREKLAALFNISEQQMSYITNAEAGHGLMKIGNALVPFVNRFPKNTELYRRIATKPGEMGSWGKILT